MNRWTVVGGESVGGEAVANRWAVSQWTVVDEKQNGDHWLPATDHRSAEVVGVLFAGLWSWVVREETRGRRGAP